MSARPSVGDRALELGRAAFGADWQPTMEARANGRIEVIGNHIDYNGGPVLAAAIDRGITIPAAATTTQQIRVSFPDLSDGVPESLSVGQLRDWRATEPGGPVDYLRGVIAAAMEARLAVRTSLDVVVHGDIPVAGGVSSSAALCVGLALTVVEEPLARPALVRLAQQAEHRAGTPCGTMDQSASVFGGMILFGGSPDNVTAVPIDLGDHRFVVLGSGIQRSLSSSAYSDRVDESGRALELLRSHVGRSVETLAEISPDELEAAWSGGVFAAEDTLYARARHVVTEVERVRSALTALDGADWETFGRLMTASGRSSATDYAISHPRVEELVTGALTVPGVLGARMMGGGEGGNALALVQTTAISELEATLADGYYRRHQLDASEQMFVCRLGEAAASVASVAEH